MDSLFKNTEIINEEKIEFSDIQYKQIDGVVQPYIYIGKGNTVEYSGEKPITVKIKLDNVAPVSLSDS